VANEKPYQRRILISPLNWGLGHATRLVPIIDALLQQGHYVLLAGESPALDVLIEAFPDLDWVTLKGHRIKLSGGNSQWFKLVQQAPRFLLSIYQEFRLTQEIIENHSIDLIVSDNRYGVRSNKVPSILITHQTKPFIGKHFSSLQAVSNLISKKLICCFNECWIPDDEKHRLAGSLSEQLKGISTRYIGLLSRLAVRKQVYQHEDTIDVLVLLSGPEPQRTRLEQQLLALLQNTNYETLILSGQPQAAIRKIGKITLLPHCEAARQEAMMHKAKFIICRSGYSSLMDLMHCRRKALLIPTPGQFEQELLAQRMAEHFGFDCVEQSKLSADTLKAFFIKKQTFPSVFKLQSFILPALISPFDP